jgi:hypothetical protein
MLPLFTLDHFVESLKLEKVVPVGAPHVPEVHV